MSYRGGSRIVKDLASIVIPVYGSFDYRRALLTIESAKKQQNVNVEIVVCEQGGIPKLKEKLDSSTKYIFSRHLASPTLSDFRPGLVRNLAVSISTGEFLYTNDADILFMNPNYIKQLMEMLKKDPLLSLQRPARRNLIKTGFNEFLERVNLFGINEAINSLDLKQDYIATTDGKQLELKVVTKKTEYEKTFIALIDDFEKYTRDACLKGREPTIWLEDRHAGGNFIRRQHFDLVGGYCEAFINWGCEDADLQWKLSQIFRMQLFPKVSCLEVLHLDHDREYFSARMWKRNEELLAERKQKRIWKVINEDLRTNIGLKCKQDSEHALY